MVIVSGETGSGKTTQLPKICLSIGRGEQGLIGCTQVTEILNTPGVALAGLLPAGLELSTLYVAAVARSSGAAPAATELIALLSDPSHEATRRDCGFD